MEVDYMVVGLGLAGLAFCRALDENNKTYIVFENNSQRASKVAGGMYNPVILKRFTPVWNGTKQLKTALPFYTEFEKQFKKRYHYSVDIYRIFKSIEEQNNWFVAADKPFLSEYLKPEILHTLNKGVISKNGYGIVTNTGRIDTNSLLADFNEYLHQTKRIIEEEFEYNLLEICKNEVWYKNISASKIVFCEGFGIKANPFFNELPLQGTKGELITIKAPELKVDFLIKGAVFVLPLGNDLYKVGATFNWTDKSNNATDEGRQELIRKLNTCISTPYQIVSHTAGIRPTVIDRRPLVGRHHKYDNIAVLNGLGTRGVMLAPVMAKILYNNLEGNKPISQEISLNRFH